MRKDAKRIPYEELERLTAVSFVQCCAAMRASRIRPENPPPRDRTEVTNFQKPTDADLRAGLVRLMDLCDELTRAVEPSECGS